MRFRNKRDKDRVISAVCDGIQRTMSPWNVSISKIGLRDMIVSDGFRIDYGPLAEENYSATIVGSNGIVVCDFSETPMIFYEPENKDQIKDALNLKKIFKSAKINFLEDKTKKSLVSKISKFDPIFARYVCRYF